MTKKSNILKNLFATASAVAVLAGGVSTAVAANKETAVASGGTAATGTAGDWDFAAAPVNSDTLQFMENNVTIDFDAPGATNMGGVDLNNKDTPKIVANQSIAIGSIGNAKANNLASLNIVTGKEVSLNGKAAGVVSVLANTYTGLGVIDFAGGTGKLTSDAAAPLTLDNATVTGAATGGVLDVKTDLSVKHSSFANIKTINLTATKKFEINVSTEATGGAVARDLIAAGGGMTFADATAEFIITRTDAANNDVTFDLKDNIDPGGAGQGIVRLHNTSSGNGKLILKASGGKVLGIAGANTLAAIEVAGRVEISTTDLVTIGAALLNVGKGANLLINSTAVAGANAANVAIGTSLGTGVGAATMTVDVNSNFDILDGHTIAFSHADSILGFSNTSATDKTVTLKGTLDPGAPSTGILNLTAGTNKLTIAKNGAHTLGDAGGNTLKEINALAGPVIINTDVPVYADTINVKSGSLSGDANTMAKADITIGTVAVAGPPPVAAVAATLTLDGTTTHNVILLDGGKTIKFNAADSILQLTSAKAGANTTFTLNGGNLKPTLVTATGDADTDITGILQLTSGTDGQKLIVAKNGAETIGTANNMRLKELIIDAISAANNRETEVNLEVFAKTITLGSGAGTAPIAFTQNVDTGAGGLIKFAGPSVVTVGGAGVTTASPTIDFNTKAGKLTLVDGTLKVDTISNSGNAELIFTNGNLEPYTLGGSITAILGKINVGTANNNLPKGNFTVTEIQSTGVNTTTVADGFNLTGAIDSTGGASGKFTFAGDASISGTVGNHTAVGNITIKGAAGKVVDFQDTVRIDGTGDLIFNSGVAGTAVGTAKFKTDLVADGKNIAFTEDGTILIYNDSNHSIKSATMTIPDNATQRGTIKVDGTVGAARTVIIDAKIGDITGENTSLKRLEVNTTGIVELKQTTGGNEVASIRDVLFSANGTLKFNQANGQYRIQNMTATAGGKLDFAENTVFISNAADVDFGRYDAKLASIGFSAGNKTVTIGDKIYIYASSLATNNFGEFIFEGEGGFDVEQGANKIKSLKVNAADEVQIFNNFKSTDPLEVSDGGIVTFSEDVTNITIDHADGIKSIGGAQKGNIIFANDSELTVNSAIGGGVDGKIDKILFSGNNVTFATPGSLTATTLKFEQGGDDGIVVTTSGVDLGAKNITATSTDNTLIVTGNQTLTGNIAAFGNIQVNGVSTVTINTNNFAAGLTSQSPDTVSLVVAKDVNFIELGGNNALRDVDFQGNSTVTGGTFTKTAKIAAGKKVKFGGPLTATTLTLTGAGSTSEFADGAVMDSAIVATLPGEGIVDFAGSADVKKAIGRVKEVNFKGLDRTKAVKLYNNIGGAANFGKSSVALENNINMTSGASFDGTAMDLGANKLTVSGGNVKLTGEIDFKTTLSGDKVGSVELNAGASNNIDFSGLTLLKITVDDSASVENGVNTYTFLDPKSGKLTGFDASKITDGNPDDKFVRWTVSTDPSGKITLVSTNQTGKSLEQTFEKLNISKDLVSSELLNMFNNAEKGTQGFDLRTEINKLPPEEQADVIVRLSNNTVVSNTEVISDALNDATSQISTRISSLITPMAFTAPTPAGGGSASNAIRAAFDDSLPMSGVAAGDSAERHGVWASPFYSENTQKKRDTSAGYKARSSGLTAGFDTMATDDMIVGAAGTFINTNVSHKDFKKGDKTRVDSLMFTVYGVQQMANDWYIQGVANFGSSRVKNSENRGGLVKQVAKGNYTSMSFSGEVLGGYNYVVSEQAVVTPMAGLSYSNSNDSSYRESGTTNQNLDITKRASHKIEGILGARAATMPYDISGMAISPEAHLYVRHDMTGKNPKVDVRLDGLGLLPSKSTKAARTFVTLGTSVSAKYSMMDYGIGYDATMASKYIGHQGTLKVRVNF